MHILLIRVDLHLPFCHSLKEKRHIIKPLLNTLRQDFNISASEVENHDVWQTATLAIVAVGGMREALERMEREVIALLDSQGEAEVAEFSREWL